ncbi:MAG TPA: glycosyltransferase family 2 protein [Pyrinomonadaceae bacterium]|nr:glycosyltransferase family 2 protein [Pyrinomonadaceae bacterium]
MKSVKLSIAMCTYNGAAYLSEQFESLATQTRVPDELVVCDDSSTDKHTREMVEAFARRAPFAVRLFINKQNLGSKRSFELAIRRCRGEIIFLCDQDDVWREDKLAVIERAFLSSPQTGLVFSDAEVGDENLVKLGSLWQNFSEDSQADLEAGRAFHALLRRNLVTGATLAFRSNLRRLVLPIPTDTSFQHDAWIALIIAAVARVTFISEPLIKYRQHPGQQIGASIAGTRYEERDSPLIESVREHPYPTAEIHAFKTLYARLITKCSGLVSNQHLEAIKGWIGRLENEKAVIENDASDSAQRQTWEEMNEYLTQRAIRIEPYLRADLSRLRYRLRPRDIGAVWSEIRADRRHGLQWPDRLKED